MKIVRFRWVDSAGAGQWDTLDDITKEEPSNIESVGILVKDADNCVIIVQSVAFEPDGSRHKERADNWIVIPKVAIIGDVETLGHTE